MCSNYRNRIISKITGFCAATSQQASAGATIDAVFQATCDKLTLSDPDTTGATLHKVEEMTTLLQTLLHLESADELGISLNLLVTRE